MTLNQKFKILFTRSELKKLIILFFGMLLMAVLEVVGVASIVPFMAVITSPELIRENTYLSIAFGILNTDNENDFIILLGCIIVFLLLISNLLQAFITWKITYFSQKQLQRLQVRLLDQYLAQPYSFYLNRNTSELGKNILEEVSAVVNGVLLQSLLAASKIIVVIFIFSLLLVLNPYVALGATTLLLGSYMVIFRLVKNRLNRIGIKKTEAVFQAYKAANEAMAGIKEIKLGNSEKEFVRRFISPSKILAYTAAQASVIASLPRYLLEVVAFGGLIVITIILFSKSPENSNQIMPIISLYAMAGYRLMPALQQIYGAMSNIKFNIPAFNILVNDFERSTVKISNELKIKPIELNDKLEVKRVSFSYENSEYSVLKNLTLNIKKNTTVGLVGSTGEGKTTLVDIILGLLTPESGSIIVDGEEINQSNMSAWQKNIGYVPQNIYLNDDTIERNIAFAVPGDEIDRDLIIAAAKMANVDKFIQTLPDQYKTFVGERGVRLSGGQCQRLAIARALYHNPNILVFDEATSALDNITEDVIMQAINNLSHKKTIIIIAHRLSTVKKCDAIHILKNGKIIDSGNYEDLLHNNEFKEMAKKS